MSFWLWSFIGGLFGTAVMDLAGWPLRRLGVNDGLGGLLGRWVLGFRRFSFVIDGNLELDTAETIPEKIIGSLFHYAIGGGSVALVFPTFFVTTGIELPGNYIVAGLIFGVASVGLTWFLQYPCFGFRFFGQNAPRGASTIWPPALLHSLYGLGIGLVLQLAMS